MQNKHQKKILVVGVPTFGEGGGGGVKPVGTKSQVWRKNFSNGFPKRVQSFLHYLREVGQAIMNWPEELFRLGH